MLDPCDNTTEDALAAPTSVKVKYNVLNTNSAQCIQISVYSPRNGADVITVVSREYEKALAGDSMKSICKAFFANPHLRQEAVSEVSRMVSDECSLLCKKKALQPVSLFRHMSLEQAENFS